MKVDMPLNKERKKRQNYTNTLTLKSKYDMF